MNIMHEPSQTEIGFLKEPDQTESSDITFHVSTTALTPNNVLIGKDYSIEKLSDDVPNIFNILLRGKPTRYILKIGNCISDTEREVRNLINLRNMRGIPTIEAYGLNSEYFTFQILEKLPGKDLYEYTREKGKMSEVEAKHVFRRLLKILSRVHDKGIIHADIKPENILYDSVSGKVSLIDFEGKSTRYYMSPEAITHKYRITEKLDIWNLAVTIYVCLRREQLFRDNKEIIEGTSKADFTLNPKNHKPFSPELTNFLLNILKNNPAERPTAKQCLAHPWFSSKTRASSG